MIRCFSLAALGATLLLAQRQNRRGSDFNLNIHEDNAEHCSDLRAEPRGELAQTIETFTLSRAEAPALEINAPDRGHIKVMGEPRADYAVEVCKFAVAADLGTANQMLNQIAVSRAAGKLSATGPSAENGEWLAYFLVHAPKDASLDLETRNGPIAVRGIDGQVKVQADNGPVAVRDCGGHVDVRSINGPIAFEGSGGDVHLAAENGPIAVKISADLWNGNQLEAHTNNGPLSLKLPANFHSGVRVETDGHSPMSCKAAICMNAASESANGQRVLQMNGSTGAIHISTHNGPVAVGVSDSLARIM